MYRKLVLSALSAAMAACVSFSSPQVSAADAAQPTAQNATWALWSDVQTRLRGVNIYQRRLYQDYDGTSDGVWERYTQADFDRLAAMGANYVHISHPGLYRETPPYVLDQGMQDSLDGLLAMIGKAGLHAVIAFRTGPGRNECIFLDDAHCAKNRSVWQDAAAQDAWAAMWRETARRYDGNSTVVGFDLMVEPDGQEAVHANNPSDFYPRYADSSYDWNMLFPRLVRAVRESSNLPVLIGGMGWSSLEWLPYLKPSADPFSVYTAHQYDPHEYTHQGPFHTMQYPPAPYTFYPDPQRGFDRAWLQTRFAAIEQFRHDHGVPVAVTEYGVTRWAEGADLFLADSLAEMEARHVNHAVWLWHGANTATLEDQQPFNYRLGAQPDNPGPSDANPLICALRKNWWEHREHPERSALPPGIDLPPCGPFTPPSSDDSTAPTPRSGLLPGRMAPRDPGTHARSPQATQKNSI
ncbi:glycoside hydrolase family 5 protein [Dokdonella soli]|uniref:Glycoside hydrolase family 5 domain-containing protein n=2 Tax=Dokdonella soli TaxID=529810 RepID=A0ABP3TIQ1_9GAMM